MNSTNPDWVNISIEAWGAQEIELNAGAQPSAIDALEWELGFKFPEEFRQFYLVMDGFREWDMDVNMISIWPLSRMLEERADAQDTDFIGFCDFLINSHSIGFHKARPGIFKKYYSAESCEFEKMADGFREAIMLINDGSPFIY